MRVLFSSILLMLFSAANAASVIDFESIATGTGGPLTIDGFIFSGSAGVSADSQGNHIFGTSDAGFSDDYGAFTYLSFSLTREDSGAFAYYGADITSLSVGFQEISVIGYVAGGGVASDPVGTGDWLNLVQVQFSSSGSFPGGVPYYEGLWIDNVQLQAVPIPAAVWLFGSALGGLGYLRRRQVTKS